MAGKSLYVGKLCVSITRSFPSARRRLYAIGMMLAASLWTGQGLGIDHLIETRESEVAPESGAKVSGSRS